VQKSPLLPPLLLLEPDGDDLEERERERDAEELYKVNGGEPSLVLVVSCTQRLAGLL
jgi:hypothetical protein